MKKVVSALQAMANRVLLPQDEKAAIKNRILQQRQSSFVLNQKEKNVRIVEKNRHRGIMTEKEFFTLASKICLTSKERVLCKERILKCTKILNFSWIFAWKKLSSLVASLLIVTLVGGSAAYAAEDALPGDLLYPVKIHVNEEVLTRFASTPYARAKMHARRAEKRLEEMEMLLSTSKITDEKEEKLREYFEEHIQKMNEVMNTLLQDDAGIRLASDIVIDMEATMRAHGKMIEGFHSTRPSLRGISNDIHRARVSAEQLTAIAELQDNANEQEELTQIAVRSAKEEMQKMKTKTQDVSPTVIEAIRHSQKLLDSLSDNTTIIAEERMQKSRRALRHLREAHVLLNTSPVQIHADVPSIERTNAEGDVSLMQEKGLNTPAPDSLPMLMDARVSNDEDASTEISSMSALLVIPPDEEQQNLHDDDALFEGRVREEMAQSRMQDIKRILHSEKFMVPPHLQEQIGMQMSGADLLLQIGHEQRLEGNDDAVMTMQKALKHADMAKKTLQREGKIKEGR